MLTSPGGSHGLRVLQIRHHHSRDGQHEATHHLLSVLRAPGVGKADEGAVDSNPSAPLQLEHQAAHAEDHAEQIHVVWCRVVQGRITLARRRLVPQYFVRSPWVRHTVGGHSDSEVGPLPLLEWQLPAWKWRMVFTVTPAVLALVFLAAEARIPPDKVQRIRRSQKYFLEARNGVRNLEAERGSLRYSQCYLHKAEISSLKVGNRK